MSEPLPALLSKPEYPAIVQTEEDFLVQARGLLDDGYPDHALLDLWNASIHNLRRKVEAYGVDLFLSSVKDESGRKKFNKDGDSIPERWNGVDEIVLITGATRLGILNKKAGKALEMINWMRNHASPAHSSDGKVEQEDVYAFAIILYKNLFEFPLPDPGHSPSGLFNPIKSTLLDEEKISMLKDQINSYRTADIRVAFGFMLDMICKGENPAFQNCKSLFYIAWEKATEELKKTAGERYQSMLIDPDSDDSSDKGAKIRLIETLVSCDGVKYIPDAARAKVYRHAVKSLAKAKDQSYGWDDEEKAARSLKQFGTHVPSVAFEDVYQEIIAVWCGNYWGRSNAHTILVSFIDNLNTTKLLQVARMMVDNERASGELFQARPKNHAICLLELIKDKLTIQANIDEIDKFITLVTEK